MFFEFKPKETMEWILLIFGFLFLAYFLYNLWVNKRGRFTVKKGRHFSTPFVIKFYTFFFKNEIKLKKEIVFPTDFYYTFEGEKRSQCQKDWLKIWGLHLWLLKAPNFESAMVSARFDDEKSLMEVAPYFNVQGGNFHPNSLEGIPKENFIRNYAIPTEITVNRKYKTAKVRIYDSLGKDYFEYTMGDLRIGLIIREISFYHGGDCKANRDLTVYKR